MYITCGVCNAQNFINPSVEIWGTPGICDISLPPDNWTDYSNTISFSKPDEANFLICPSTIPDHASDGNVYARMHARNDSLGEGMYQILTGFVIGNSYKIKFDYAGSNLYSGLADVQYHIFINDSDVNQTPVFHSTDTMWLNHSYIFIANNTTHKIAFRLCTTGALNGSAGIDNFNFTPYTGITNIEKEMNALIFPNPFFDKLNITMERNELVEVSLYDVTVRKLLQQSFRNSTSINTEQLAKGIYLYEVRNKNGVIKKGKIVKD